MSSTAIILTDGQLAMTACKTAHGLILGNSRYKILGVIDQNNTGKDAGLVISKHKKHIPVYCTIQHAIEELDYKPDYCVIGVAPIGGKLS